MVDVANTTEEPLRDASCLAELFDQFEVHAMLHFGVVDRPRNSDFAQRFSRSLYRICSIHCLCAVLDLPDPVGGAVSIFEDCAKRPTCKMRMP